MARTTSLARSLSFAAAFAAAAAACTSQPAQDDTAPDPCAALDTECPYCTQPGPQETCQTAAASNDAVQCTVALDDPGVIADCVVPEGGAGGDATSEAAALPTCNGAEAPADAGCSCANPCVTACTGGGCDVTCGRGITCTPSCNGGGCTFTCQAGATCKATCNGGNCIFVCEAGSTCENTCTGGGCAFQCEDEAVCNDTCPAPAVCTGP